MTDHAANKRKLAELLTAIPQGCDARSIGAILGQFCHPDCRWEVFHPFNQLDGNAAAASGFWEPLKCALPDYEQRLAFTVGGRFEDRNLVSSWGHAMGTFDGPLLGIPPTFGLVTLRFGVNAVVRDGLFAKVYVLLDLVDLMAQAGFYPFRNMPGAPLQWAFPPCDTGATAIDHDGSLGSCTLTIIEEMQRGLPDPEEIAGLHAAPSRHSPRWHPHMNWYGPAGIGSMRGRRGFRDFHGALFLQAFPDRTGFPRVPGGPEDAPGHYIRVGDGNYAVTGGWPSLHGTHLGAEWLGLPPTGCRIQMRVADWYRLDADGLIIDNWVMMDIPHMVHQMGLDIFHDLQFRANPQRERWPLAD